MQLPTSHYPMPKNYHPIEDVSNELNAQGVQAYQELIGEIRWGLMMTTDTEITIPRLGLDDLLIGWYNCRLF